MTSNFKEWVLDDSERQKYHTWTERINVAHTGTRHIQNETVNWTPLVKPLSDCVVSLFTTGGVHLRTDKAFDVSSAHGDHTFRRVPTNVDTADLAVTHTHYNHVDADRDVNCMFPLDRIKELRDQGIIGGITENVYSIMGFNPDPANLVEETAPELARLYKEEGADLVLMTCG